MSFASLWMLTVKALPVMGAFYFVTYVAHKTQVKKIAEQNEEIDRNSHNYRIQVEQLHIVQLEKERDIYAGELREKEMKFGEFKTQFLGFLEKRDVLVKKIVVLDEEDKLVSIEMTKLEGEKRNLETSKKGKETEKNSASTEESTYASSVVSLKASYEEAIQNLKKHDSDLNDLKSKYRSAYIITRLIKREYEKYAAINDKTSTKSTGPVTAPSNLGCGGKNPDVVVVDDLSSTMKESAKVRIKQYIAKEKTAQEACAEKENLTSQFTEAVSTAKTNYESAQKSQISANLKVKDLSRLIESLKEQIALKEAEIKAKEKEKEEIKTKADAEKQSFITLHTQIQNKQNEIDKLRLEIIECEAQINELTYSIKMYQSRLNKTLLSN